MAPQGKHPIKLNGTIHVLTSPLQFIAASAPRTTAPSVMQGCVGTNAQRYGNCAPLPVLPVVHNTWTAQSTYTDAYVCTWTPITALFFA